MSGWDNVLTINNVALYAGAGASTTATIFNNGAHQIPVSLYVSFDFFDSTLPGPTQDEIKAAITWINGSTGDPIRTLTPSAKNQYSCFYDEDSNQFSNQTKDESTTRSFQNEMPFFFMCTDQSVPGDSTMLSLIFHAKRTDQSDFVYDCSMASNEFHAALLFKFAPAKHYGAPGDPTLTNIITKKIASNAGYINSDYDSYDQRVEVFTVKIDSEQFHIADCASDPLSNDARCYQYRYKENPSHNTLHNTYYLNQTYHIDTTITTSHDVRNFCGYIGNVNSSFTLPAYELHFLCAQGTFHKCGDDVNHYDPDLNIRIHDQFGNKANVIVNCNPVPNVISVG